MRVGLRVGLRDPLLALASESLRVLDEGWIEGWIEVSTTRLGERELDAAVVLVLDLLLD